MWILFYILVCVYLLNMDIIKNYKFKRWCILNGINVYKVDIGIRHGMRGLYATEHIKKGDLLVEVPIDSCIYVETEPNLSMDIQDLELACKVMKFDSPDSKYKGYIDHMPQHVNVISHWSDEEIHKINYPPAFELRNKQILEDSKYPSYLRRYLDLVRSRRIIFRQNDYDLLMMIPVIDLINHGNTESSSTPKFGFDIEIIDNVVKMYSPHTYTKNSEILISYGDSHSSYESTSHHLCRHGIFI